MTNLPLAPLTATSSSAATLSPLGTALTASLQITLTDVPPELANLVRTLQTRVVSLEETAPYQFTLTSNLGTLTASLPPSLGETEKQQLVRKLLALIQNDASPTLTVPSGKPPTKATLSFLTEVPKTTATSAAPPTTALQQAPKPVVVGDRFTAIVLDPSPSPKSALPVLAVPIKETSAPAPHISASPPPSVPLQPPPAKALAAYQTLAPTPPQSTNAPTPLPVTATPAPIMPPGTINQSPLPPPPSVVETPPIKVFDTPSPQTVSVPPPLPDRTIPTESLAAPPMPQAKTVPPATSHAMALPLLQEVDVPPPPQQASAQPTPTAHPSPPAASQKPSAALPSAPPLLTPGNVVSLRVVSLVPEGASGAIEEPPAQASYLLATVKGKGSNGEPVLATSHTSLFVKTSATLPVGTSLIVALEPFNETAPLTAEAEAEKPLPPLAASLASLEKAVPQTFQNLMADFLPQASDKLPGALMFFLSAFKRGNVGNWLGDAAVDHLIDRGYAPLVRQISEELTSSVGSSRDAVVGEWKSYPLPLYAQNQLEHLTLYVHNDPEHPHDRSGKPATRRPLRFLIDMRLSRLGPMQLDGFVQPAKLDVVLRSEKTLPDGFHHELRSAYIRALEAVRYAGTLNFQVGRQHWIQMETSAQKGVVT